MVAEKLVNQHPGLENVGAGVLARAGRGGAQARAGTLAPTFSPLRAKPASGPEV